MQSQAKTQQAPQSRSKPHVIGLFTATPCIDGMSLVLEAEPRVSNVWRSSTRTGRYHALGSPRLKVWFHHDFSQTTFGLDKPITVLANSNKVKFKHRVDIKLPFTPHSECTPRFVRLYRTILSREFEPPLSLKPAKNLMIDNGHEILYSPVLTR